MKSPLVEALGLAGRSRNADKAAAAAADDTEATTGAEYRPVSRSDAEELKLLETGQTDLAGIDPDDAQGQPADQGAVDGSAALDTLEGGLRPGRAAMPVAGSRRPVSRVSRLGRFAPLICLLAIAASALAGVAYVSLTGLYGNASLAGLPPGAASPAAQGTGAGAATPRFPLTLQATVAATGTGEEQ